MLIRHLWQLKTVVFLHWYLIRVVIVGGEGLPNSISKADICLTKKVFLSDFLFICCCLMQGDQMTGKNLPNF